MTETDTRFEVSRLGECLIASPLQGVRFVADDECVLYDTDPREIKRHLDQGKDLPAMEVAGPQARIYFDPARVRCGIVTCGGLCPGLNDVIRAIVMGLYHHYGVRSIFGFRFGFEGLSPKYAHVPMELNPLLVTHINQMGGTILGSSRGPQDVPEMVDALQRLDIGILFTIGGDGTLRGAHAITEEVRRRGLKIAVVGIPKTIDNDICFVQTSFGFETAVFEARRATYAAHSEAEGAPNGIGLVKLMGRDSGFIAAFAVLADSNVNFCLVPEVPFKLDRLLAALHERLKKRGHAVIVVAEGAGQNLMKDTGERDASGNVRHGDIGIFLRDRITAHFGRIGVEVNLKYIDPSYTIRSMPAIAHDSAFCLLLGQNAVHAAMSGRTDMVVGFWNRQFTHVPIRMAVAKRQKIDPNDRLWGAVLSSTGQPRDLE
jgi:6-phosphofructokinase 1